MAFDGPGPFHGDPVFNHLDSVQNQTPAVLQQVLANAFSEVIKGGASRKMPAEFFTMLGFDPLSAPAMFVDIDEGVWAWACAEILAAALGHDPETPIPEPFGSVALSIPQPRRLVADAIKALDLIVDTAHSELGGFVAEGCLAESRDRIARLRDVLGRWHLRPV